MKHLLLKAGKFLFPFLLGGIILWWMYRGFSWQSIRLLAFDDLRWSWMGISLLFGIVPQALRGLRWRLALAPLGEKARTVTCVNAIYLSYASSLIVPRIGELTRCAVLKRYENTSFPKALGTVVTERIIDSAIVLLATGAVLLVRLPVFLRFFRETGTNLTDFFAHFTAMGYLVTAICGVALLVLTWIIVRQLSVFGKLQDMMRGFRAGIVSVRRVRNLPLYLAYSLGIWLAYFLHFYLTFYCFGFTAHLGVLAGLVVFCVGSIAVVVPTPNGAGPWHFAVKTILVLYGVSEAHAIGYALIVHTLQTTLLILLGVYALIRLPFLTRTGGAD